MDTHEMICDFGIHKGIPWTRIPVNYVLWVAHCEHGSHTRAAVAQAELARRGTKTPTIDISGHALDRASQKCLDLWLKDSKGGETEGISAWLTRVAEEALKDGVRDNEKIHYRRMSFIFDFSMAWPALKTVMRKNEGLF